ncbi:VWA domain-containing protein [Nocardioides sp.]|uniref:vWA domain-containing protein n=1 Tax=Nocardioides sp. TaxID=35761 RepID=UPI0035137118
MLDRSGSMAGAPLAGAQQALIDLVRRLDPADDFGLVTFDDAAQVVVPTGPLTDKDAVVAAIRSVVPGGTTDLSAGYLRGLRELRRALAARGAGTGGTVLVVSDGHVNAGVRDVATLAAVTAQAYGERIVTSTLGYGRGYDETLLAALARSGSGNHVYAADPDAAGAAIAGEVDGLLAKVAQGVALTVALEPSVEVLRLFNDLPVHTLEPGRVMIELGDLYAAERRKLLLTLRVPALAGLGLARVATLELAHVELPALIEHTVTLPIAVNVVPGDQAAGRVPDPVVTSEKLFQLAQDVKRQASEAFERGEFARGQQLIDRTRKDLDDAAAAAGSAPEALRAPLQAEIAAEIGEVEKMARLGEISGPAGAPVMSKLTRESYHRANRKRGRAPAPEATDAPEQDDR